MVDTLFHITEWIFHPKANFDQDFCLSNNLCNKVRSSGDSLISPQILFHKVRFVSDIQKCR